MWIEHSKKIDDAKAFFLKMSPEEFDKYMREIYPEFFADRNKPMNETCMCWWFDIGPGWYWILDKLCQKLMVIRKATGIVTKFSQIKEKFAGGRFYNGHSREFDSEINWDEEQDDLWGRIIDNEVNTAQDLCEYVCSHCGEYKHDVIYIGRWAYDVCEKCLLEQKPEIKKALEDWKLRKEVKDDDVIWMADKKELSALKKWSKDVIKRVKKDQDKIMKKYTSDLKKCKK